MAVFRLTDGRHVPHLSSLYYKPTALGFIMYRLVIYFANLTVKVFYIIFYTSTLAVSDCFSFLTFVYTACTFITYVFDAQSINK